LSLGIQFIVFAQQIRLISIHSFNALFAMPCITFLGPSQSASSINPHSLPSARLYRLRA
jgi:hypothetical protein